MVARLAAALAALGSPATGALAQFAPEEAARFLDGTDARPVTRSGWAGIEVGMDLEGAARAGGFRVLHPGIWGDSRSEPMDCNAFRLGGAPPNLEVYVVDGVVDSIRVSMSDEGPWTRFVTENGVGLGDSAAAVRAAYPRVAASASHYLEGPDHDLHEGGGGALGLRFMIMGGDVVSISAGGQSRDWSDGCG